MAHEGVRIWRIGDRTLALDRPVVMGIVNATPDSFSTSLGRGAGGTEAQPPGPAPRPSLDELLGQARRLVEDGADILDVGGESTRPGARPVAADEQIVRTLPLIMALRGSTDVPISIDTTRAAVAEAALRAGAVIVNDVSAGLDDPALLPLAARYGAGLVLMHRRRPPDCEVFSNEYTHAPEYHDLVEDVCRFLRERAAAGEAAGVARESIVLDPGLGFGKSVEQNFELIAATPKLAALGYPVLGAASRKSFIGAVTGVASPQQRVVGSAAVAVAQYLGGARIFRAHDVAAMREALAVAEAVVSAGASLSPVG